jgi:antitoxin component YwqK of YwqJK toxin-antitoxin module
VPNGKVRYYHLNNRIRIDGEYTNNLRSGEWTFYDVYGKVMRRTTFTDGVAADQDKLDQQASDELQELDKSRGQYIEPEELAKQWNSGVPVN